MAFRRAHPAAAVRAHHHLAGELAGREPVHRRQQTVEHDVVRFDQLLDRQTPRSEQRERGGETVVVVVVRADDRQLEDDRPIVVDPRQLASGTDEHERAGVVELVERGLRGPRVARALEGDRVRRLHWSSHRGARELVRRHRPRRRPGRPRTSSRRCGFDDCDVFDTAGAQDREHQEPDRAGTRDEDAVAGHRAREVRGVQRDRSRFGERGGADGKLGRNREQPFGFHHDVTAERAAEPEVVGWRLVEAHRRPAPPARAAFAAARRGRRDDARADERGVDPGAGLAHRARPFMAEHRSRSRVLLEHEMQVGATDPAVRHFDEGATGSRFGHRQRLHLDATLARVDRRRHPAHDAHGTARMVRRAGYDGTLRRCPRWRAPCPRGSALSSSRTTWPASCPGRSERWHRPISATATPETRRSSSSTTARRYPST